MKVKLNNITLFAVPHLTHLSQLGGYWEKLIHPSGLIIVIQHTIMFRSHRGCDHMVVGFTSTHAISGC